MPVTPLEHLTSEASSEWVRLRTMINLRWMAILGQFSAVLFAVYQLGLILDVGLCFVAIGAAVLFNIASLIVYPANKRLSERESMLTLLFDMAQLVFLLYLTGGLNNPFALLILAPVIISATTLRLQSTVFLGLLSIFLISVLANYYVPLGTRLGFTLGMPELFVTGHWIALVIGVVFLAGYARRVSLETHSMTQALLATQMALSREQKLTDLTGVVAAAAHELGTPLATIKLVSSELADELADRPELLEDVVLIRDQDNRCRDILRDMGRSGKEDMLMQTAPVSAVVQEAAEPHESRGKTLHVTCGPAKGAGPREPTITRHPEIIHGVRNLVQNAVDFARTNVWIDIRWTENMISVTVADDGKGYPSDMLGRIGDPFVRRRRTDSKAGARPEYDGMGLGLFIAKTLLERSGADLTFANGSDPFLSNEELPERSGAIVAVAWPRNRIERELSSTRGPLGENARLGA